MFPLAPEYIGYCDVGLADDLFTASKPEVEHISEHIFKYHVNFDQIRITDEIGAICVSRPTNPTGNVLTDSEMEKLSDLAFAHKIPLVIDNAYGTPFPNIIFTKAKPLWNEHTVVCMSLSKLGLPVAVSAKLALGFPLFACTTSFHFRCILPLRAWQESPIRFISAFSYP